MYAALFIHKMEDIHICKEFLVLRYVQETPGLHKRFLKRETSDWPTQYTLCSATRLFCIHSEEK